MNIREILEILKLDQNNPPLKLKEKFFQKFASEIEILIPYWQAGAFIDDPTTDLSVGFLISQYKIWAVDKKMEENPAFRNRHLN